MNFKRKLYFTIIIAAILYLIGFFWTGWDQIVEAFNRFRWWVLPIALLLSFANYLVRFTKWHYYLSLLQIPLPRKDSFKVFLAGLVMSATPGKFGEIFKSYLVKQINQTPISRSAPIVLAERFTDFVALVLMSLLGITLHPQGLSIFAISIGIILLVLLLVSWKTAAQLFLGWIGSLPLINKHRDKLTTAYESTYTLISPKPLFWTTLISIVSWFCECLAFYLVLWGFNAPIPLLPATFVYAFATIMGALLITPGGIGPTEVTMGGLLLLLLEVPKGIATSATIIIRLCTLGFAVVVGLIVLSLCAKTFEVIPEEESLEEAIDESLHHESSPPTTRDGEK